MDAISGQLRAASSAGEPLNPEIARWAERVLGCPVRDRHGQTETGMLINNHHGLQHPIREPSELQQHVRRRLSAHEFPREIDFVPDLPKTPSGRVQRFSLRQR